MRGEKAGSVSVCSEAKTCCRGRGDLLYSKFPPPVTSYQTVGQYPSQDTDVDIIHADLAQIAPALLVLICMCACL